MVWFSRCSSQSKSRYLELDKVLQRSKLFFLHKVRRETDTVAAAPLMLHHLVTVEQLRELVVVVVVLWGRWGSLRRLGVSRV